MQNTEATSHSRSPSTSSIRQQRLATPSTPVSHLPQKSEAATISSQTDDGETTLTKEKVDDDKMDVESGQPRVEEELTAEEILSKDVETLPMRQLIPAFFGVALTMFMAALDNSIVSTAIPKIGTEFEKSNQVELIFTAYVLTANAFQGLYGSLSNVLGRKITAFVAIGFFVAGSVLSGASQSMNMFLACRALAGVGAGGIFSISNIIVADLVSIRDRGKYQGAISAVFAISALVGPVMGGAFVDHVSWRWCFYIQCAFAVITVPTLVVMLRLPRPKGDLWGKVKGIDWLGTFFMATTTVCLLLPTNLGGTMYPWNSPLIITLYVLAVPSTIAFLYVEAYHAKQPIVPPYLWKNRNVTSLFGINVFMGMTFWSLIFYLPIYFQIIEHETATEAGLTMIPLEAGIFISSNLVGWLVSRYGNFRPYIFSGAAISTLGMGLLLVLANTSAKVIHVIVLIICGFGIGPLFPTLIVAIQASVDRKDLATVSALLNFFRMTGSGLGVAINGALFQNQLSNALAESGVPEKWTQVAKLSAQRIVELPEEYRGTVEGIYLDAMKTVFKATIPMAVMMILLTFLVRHVRLNPKISNPDVVDSEKDKDKEEAVVNREGDTEMISTSDYGVETGAETRVEENKSVDESDKKKSA